MNAKVQIVELGCLACKTLDATLKANALDCAMWCGIILGGIAANGTELPLCAHHADRWEMFEPKMALAIESWRGTTHATDKKGT